MMDISSPPFVLSAIIPTWCEASRIASTVAACASFADEVIVADAASPDGTAHHARMAGARVVLAPRGRGVQLNAGAREARGGALVFVHADTHLPERARAAIRSALSRPDVLGGNFKLRFVPDTPLARALGWGNHLRRVLLRMYYGDSAIFVRRSAFERLGGFRDYALFEDHDFVRRLEQLGATHYETSIEARASTRRFARRPLRTLAVWTGLQLLYSCGVEPSTLARLYRDAR
jgi:rSAM/selenodomain-associated transferase 2